MIKLRLFFKVNGKGKSMIKPRIRKAWLTPSVWSCSGGGIVGYGYTLPDAYANWLNRLKLSLPITNDRLA